MRYTNYKFQVPDKKVVRVIIDTDAANEADDQFAIVQAMLSPKLDIRGFIAAHFGKEGSEERSFAELKKIFGLMHAPEEWIFHGAQEALPDKGTPRVSEGAELIIREAMKEDDRPLFVLNLGAITDLASALLMKPEIENRLTAVWIGGGPYPNGSLEFNLGNDICAANVVFSSRIPLWQVPKNVYEMMPVSMTELELEIAPYGEIGAYLFEELNEHANTEPGLSSAFRSGETWVLGDSPAVGLLLYEHRMLYDWVQAPLVTQDQTYVQTGLNRPVRVYRSIDSRLILSDLFAKVKLFAGHPGKFIEEKREK